MTKRRDRGDGGIDERGKNSWRLRYRVKGKRITQTFHGSLSDARKELRRLLKSGDDGTHVAPDKITLGQWIAQWLAIGAPGRRQRGVGGRALARYGQLLRVHVVPVLGSRPLQQIQATELDALYCKLEGKVAASTAQYVHVVLGSCLSTAVRKGMLAVNPLERAEKIPSPGEADHGTVLDQDQLRTLVEGFRDSVLFPIVAVAAFTGARRSEILALRWSDLDGKAKTLRIERAVDHVTGQALALKAPKTARGTRTITIDDSLLALLTAEREKHLRLIAGVPDGVAVDLSLVKLPADALMFPNPPAPGEDFSFTSLRNPNTTTTEFKKRARKRGFDLRLHDLRGTHETLLLDAGVPVHVVAARCGHDPAVLLRSYAKRTRKADTSAAAVIGMMAGNILKR
ncbi:MAG TPA: tyrosine-type recombinase/integrase [Xanthobacteraceae bacterium]|nr:tyrosine-type recombinase/integrase [Xanthobacteraceae bacterium]